MDDQTKYTASRWLIFLTIIIAFTAEISNEISISYYNGKEIIDPHSIYTAIGGLCLCAMFLLGLYLGSRGLGLPLSFGLFFHLIFSKPSRYFWIVFLSLTIIAIIYHLIFW